MNRKIIDDYLLKYDNFRQNKQFAQADEIREFLITNGIEIHNTKFGTVAIGGGTEYEFITMQNKIYSLEAKINYLESYIQTVLRRELLTARLDQNYHIKAH